MYFYNDENKKLNVFFVKPHHLNLFKSNKVPLWDLKNLLFYSGISEQDVLDWITYQRGMEEKLFGTKFTTYRVTGDIKHTDLMFDMELLNPKLKSIYDSSYKIENLSEYSYRHLDDTIIILNNDNIVCNDQFTETFTCPYNALYTSILKTLGYHNTYFREQYKGNTSKGIDLAKLIYYCLK